MDTCHSETALHTAPSHSEVRARSSLVSLNTPETKQRQRDRGKGGAETERNQDKETQTETETGRQREKENFDVSESLETWCSLEMVIQNERLWDWTLIVPANGPHTCQVIPADAVYGSTENALWSGSSGKAVLWSRGCPPTLKLDVKSLGMSIEETVRGTVA